MKTFPILSLIASLVVISAEEETKPLTYIFQPFEKADISSAVTAFPDYPSYDDIKALSVIDLRSIMTSGDISHQTRAARELIERKDQATILRLVYSLKQGNSVAEDLLRRNYSLAVLPYLIEDTARGSIKRYVRRPPRGDVTIKGRVRSVATEVVVGALVNSPEITTAARDCLKAIIIGSDSGIETLSAKSRYLIQWWLLNESAINSERWDNTQPLPEKFHFPSGFTTFPPMESPEHELDSARQSHILGPSWELPESFEMWSKRIVHPELRNLDFVELTWDGKRVIEHPAKSLNPKTRQNRENRENRKDLIAGNKAELENTDRLGEKLKGISWLAWCAALFVVIGLIKLSMSHKSAR